MAQDTQQATLAADNLRPLLEKLQAHYEELEQSEYTKAVLVEIYMFLEQQRVVELASEKDALRFATQCASMVLKTGIPKLRKYPEYANDKEAHFLTQIQMDYINYLDEYCAEASKDTKVPENLGTLLLLGVVVLALFLGWYYEKSHQ